MAVSYHVPSYNPGFSPRFGNLSQVRVWNVSTPEQALNFFAMAETDGLLTHKMSSLSTWTTFYFPTTDITRVVRSVFEIWHDSGRASICEDIWLFADYGAWSLKSFSSHSPSFNLSANWNNSTAHPWSWDRGLLILLIQVVFGTFWISSVSCSSLQYISWKSSCTSLHLKTLKVHKDSGLPVCRLYCGHCIAVSQDGSSSFRSPFLPGKIQSTEFFPEGMVMRMSLDAEIMSARGPPLISRVLGYNSSRRVSDRVEGRQDLVEHTP